MNHFETILEFQRLLKEFNFIYRDLESLHKDGEPDNDVEHSYRVAMLAWMVAEEYKIPLDTGKLLRYGLIHDLVEVYAGDVSIYANTSAEEKANKEHESLLKLKEKFPRLETIWEDIEAYEAREDTESRFVYIIDKLEPILLVILSAPNHFKKRGIAYDNFVERKQKKIKDVESAAQVFNQEIMRFVEENRKELFG